MRLVLDTNIVVSGLLWGGSSRRLLELAMEETISLYSSPALIDELAHVLTYPKFIRRIALFETTSDALVARYSALVAMVTPLYVPARRSG